MLDCRMPSCVTNALRRLDLQHRFLADFPKANENNSFDPVDFSLASICRGRGANVAHHCRRGGGQAVRDAPQDALDMQLFLRIALELHLKRLLVGGIERA